MRLIDADAPEIQNCEGVARETVLGLIAKQPTVDAVEVVRCRDCRFSHLTNDGVREYCDYCDYYENGVIAVCFELDHFCSHGKRREVQHD